MEKLTFTVADTDAPLDLILQLIQKHKLNILDIDISSLLEQYLSVIAGLGEQDLEVASEFLEMASRLVYIKTVSLLPKHEDEHETLRRELSGQLVEYSICRAAARTLGEQYIGQDVFTRQAVPIEEDPAYTLTHPAHILFEALTDAMGKGLRRLPPPKELFEPIVGRPVVSVTAKIFAVLRALRESGSVRMYALYSQSGERSGIIATFLAVLELIRSKKVLIESEELRLVNTNIPPISR